MKGKRLSFRFIFFLESGLFNELRRIQIKKSFLFQARSELPPMPSCFFCRATGHYNQIPGTEVRISLISDFVHKKPAFFGMADRGSRVDQA
jgi:hypothetical protein